MIESYDFNFLALGAALIALISQWAIAIRVTGGGRFRFLFELDYQNTIWYSLFFGASIFFKFENTYTNAVIYVLLGMVFTTNILFSFADRVTTFEESQRYSNWFSHVLMGHLLFVNYYEREYKTDWWVIPAMTGAIHVVWYALAAIYQRVAGETVYARYNVYKFKGLVNLVAIYTLHTTLSMGFWYAQGKYYDTLPSYVTWIVPNVTLVFYTISSFFIKSTNMAQDGTMKASGEYARLNVASHQINDDL